MFEEEAGLMGLTFWRDCEYGDGKTFLHNLCQEALGGEYFPCISKSSAALMAPNCCKLFLIINFGFVTSSFYSLQFCAGKNSVHVPCE